MRYIVIATCLLVGCTDASWERNIGSYGNRHKVEFYSGGEKIAEWVSTGKPMSVAEEDGWQFVDEKSKLLVTVTGDVIITKLED